MSDLLTDRANAVIAVLASFVRGALFVMIGWAISRHIGALDAAAAIAAFMFTLGALSDRRRDGR